MRLPALTAALATALAGTGCIVTTSDAGPVGAAHVYWSFERAAPAQTAGFLTYDATYDSPAAAGTVGTCPESYVDTVRVASARGTFDIECTGRSGGGWVQGAVVDLLPAGSSNITLTGFRGGQAVYRSTFPVNVPVNGVDEVYVSIQGISAPLEAYAYFLYGAAPVDHLNCASAGAPNVTVEIFDKVSRAKIDDYAAGCLDPLPAFVYTGTLDLDDYWIRMKGFTPTVPATKYFDSCDVDMPHFGAQVGANGFTADLFEAPLPTCSTP